MKLEDGKREVIGVARDREAAITMHKRPDGRWTANLELSGLERPEEVWVAVERIGFEVAKQRVNSMLGPGGVEAMMAELERAMGKRNSPTVEGFGRKDQWV